MSLPYLSNSLQEPSFQFLPLEETSKDSNLLNLAYLEFEPSISNQNIISRRANATFAYLAELGADPISSKNIVTSQQALLNQQALELKTFQTTSIQGFNQASLTMQRFQQLEDQLKSPAPQIQLPAIPPPPLPTALTDSITLYRRSNIEQSMATARVVSSILDGIADTITQVVSGTSKFIAKTYNQNCERNESNLQFCKKVERSLLEVPKKCEEIAPIVIKVFKDVTLTIAFPNPLIKENVKIIASETIQKGSGVLQTTPQFIKASQIASNISKNAYEFMDKKPNALLLELHTQFNIQPPRSLQFSKDACNITIGLLLNFGFSKSIKFLSGSNKTSAKALQNEPTLPSQTRLDFSKGYQESKESFLKPPKEFNAILSRDLVLVRFSNQANGRLNWFSPIQEANRLATMDEVLNYFALLSKWGERNWVTVARIPKGEQVKFLYGRAKVQQDLAKVEVRQGGGVQYRFYDFDPNWVSQTLEIPGYNSIVKTDSSLIINKRRRLKLSDVGAPKQPKTRLPNGQFEPQPIHFEGWITPKKNYLKVKVMWAKSDDGSLSLIHKGIPHLKKIAKANQLSYVEYWGEFINSRLLEIFKKKWPNFRTEVLIEKEMEALYHIFKIPVD